MKVTKLITRILLIGLAVTLIGGIIFLIGFWGSGGDITSLSNTVEIPQTYTETSPLHTVSIDFCNADVKVYFDESAETVQIEYDKIQTKKGEPKNEITIEERDGKLSIKETQTWYSFISFFNFVDPNVVITLPADRTYTLDLHTDNGDMEFLGSACNLQKLTMESDNGNIFTTETAIACVDALNLETDNGNISLGAFTAKSLTADTDNGNVYLEKAGNVTETATLTTNNGEISIKDTLSANRIEIDTDNGDIKAERATLTATNVSLETDNGNITARLNGKKSDYNIAVTHDLGESNLVSENNHADKNLSIETNIGDIKITFIAA